MSESQLETGPASTGGSWRPFGAVLTVLALLALFVVPTTLETPAEALPVDLPDPAAAPGPSSENEPDASVVDPSSPAVPTPGSGAGPLDLRDIVDLAPGWPPVAPGPAGVPTPEEDEGAQDPEDSLLFQLAQAIPVPPELPIPEVPEPVKPFADSVAPALFLFCSIVALPGGMGGVVAGLAGDSIPGFGALLGALLLYQVPILDLCLIFGFPDEIVACDIDDAILELFPQAVPVAPPAPMGSMLGVARGVEGSLAGDTSGSDAFLESIGCEARPS